MFVRDTLSYLVLLLLHFGICLEPSSIPFTTVEWFIALFFIGRVVTEINQVIVGTHFDKGAREKTRNFNQERLTKKAKNQIQLKEMLSKYLR